MNEKIKSKDVLFFLGLFCMIMYFFMRSTAIFKFENNIIDGMMLIGYVLLIVNMLLKNETVKNYFIYLIIFIVTFITYMNAKQSLLLTMSILIIASKGIDIKRIVKFTYYISVTILIVHIGLYIVNYLLDLKSITFTFRENGVVRHSFLFVHPNSFSSYFTWTAFMRIYLKYESVNYMDYIRLIFYALFLYYFSNSKTSVICIIIAIFIILAHKKIPNIERKVIWKFIKNATIICFIFSIITIVFYNSEIIKYLDKAFTGRIRLGRAVYEYYGISMLGEYIPFGQKLEYMPEFGLNALTLDSAYYNLIFCYGILPSIYVIYLENKVNKSKTDAKIVVFMSILAIFGLMETFTLNPIFAFPLYYLRDIIVRKNKGEKNGKTNKNLADSNVI